MQRALCGLLLASCGYSKLADLPAPDANTDVGTDGQKSALPITLELLAGTLGGPGNIDGVGTEARFGRTVGVVSDSSGNLFVADTNDTIRRISSAGVVTTFAGGAAASFNFTSCNGCLGGLTIDGAGNLYVADAGNSAIRKVTPNGVVSTFAGTINSPGHVDGTGSAARFNNPNGIAIDSSGNLIIADTDNSVIRSVTPAGVVTTIAGTLGAGAGSADGPVASARFSLPSGVAVDGSGNIFVADTYNNEIRKISAGMVSTYAGSAAAGGSTDGVASAARFVQPHGIAVDSFNQVFVADSYNETIRMISNGTVTTLSGVAGMGGSTDGTGAVARYLFPTGLAFGVTGLWVADAGNNTIRKLDSFDGSVTTFAGLAADFGSTDGLGTSARFSSLRGLLVNSNGDVYVTDGSVIRKITVDETVTTLVGVAGMYGDVDGNASTARMNTPVGPARDGQGKLYVADSYSIRQIATDGSMTTVAGNGTGGFVDGTGTSARFEYSGGGYSPGLASDLSNTLYVADIDAIRRVVMAGSIGSVTTVAGTPLAGGSADGTGANASFQGPSGLAMDSAGNVLIADTGNCTVRKMTAAGEVSTVAGLAAVAGADDGLGSAARFNVPKGIAIDVVDNVYVADTLNSTIRKITPAGVTTTIAGVPSKAGIVVGANPGFARPVGLAISGDDLVIIDTDAVLLLKHGAQN